MPNIESAVKRVRTSEKAHALNSKHLSKMRTAIKHFETGLKNEDENVEELFRAAARAIDKAESKGLIHQNKANRDKSRLHAKLAK